MTAPDDRRHASAAGSEASPEPVLRLVLVVSSLTAGGAERVLSMLANQASRRGHDVTLVTLDPGPLDFQRVDPGVRRVRLGVAMRRSGALRRAANELQLLRSLRAELRRRRPDGVISFATETNGRVLLAASGLGLRVLVSERSDPATLVVGRVWSLLRRLLYRNAHAVVLQTETAREWIDAHIRARRTLVIPNPLLEPDFGDPQPRALPQPLVIALSRLRPEKGVDLLIEAFALTRRAHPAWHLAIVGDGPQLAQLERQVDALALKDAVTFVGLVDRPMATLRQGQLFVLPSRFEGFPNALLEAMSIGLPVVSFDCPSGPRSIVDDDVNGVLVPAEDVEALGAAMSRLMGDPARRARLGGAARTASARFAVERIVPQWLDALRPATAGARR